MEFESGHCGYTCWNPSVQYERYRYALFVLTRCVQQCRPIAPQPPQPQPTSSTPLHFEPSHPVLELNNLFSTQTHPFSVPGHSALSPAPAPAPTPTSVQTPAPPAPARPPPPAAAAGVTVPPPMHARIIVRAFYSLSLFFSQHILFRNARTSIRTCVLLIFFVIVVISLRSFKSLAG